MSAGTVGQILRSFSGQKVAVVGDMVADEYVVGRPAKISREAPVLILHHTHTFVRPGGATNTAYNLASLGARAAAFGVIGDDEVGRQLLQVLADDGISTTGVLVDPGRPTSTKTRILGKGVQEVQQQIVRIDRIDDRVVDGGLRDRMVDALRRGLEGVDALLISDYSNGVISPEVIEVCLREARRLGLTVTVDSHADLFRFQGVTAATPNQPEAEATLGMQIQSTDDLHQAGQRLLDGMDAGGVLITRGSEGLSLFERDKAAYHLPVATSTETQVVDPTGAGDTVAAVFTLAVSCGASMRVAAYLSNLGAARAVQKFGPATVTTRELLSELRRTHLNPPE